jgi:hypothetical protein
VQEASRATGRRGLLGLPLDDGIFRNIGIAVVVCFAALIIYAALFG